MNARQIIEKTAALFTATHWTTQNMGKVNDEGKVQFCAIGGLRIEAQGIDPLDGLDHNSEVLAKIADDYLEESTVDGDVITAYELALWAILPETFSYGGYDDVAHWLDEHEVGSRADVTLEQLEDSIIAWNDNQRAVGPILEAFKGAVARLDGEGAVAAQA